MRLADPEAHLHPAARVQLCRGADAEERQRYHLPGGPDSFAYLASGGCTSIDGVDDAAGFATVKSALTAVGISQEQQAAVFSVLAAVLWLGNVQFVAVHDDAVTVDQFTLPALRHAAALLGCSEAALLAALTTRRMQAGGEQITCELSMEAALDSRDALSKAIYAALFRWLVQQVWAGVAGEGRLARGAGRGWHRGKGPWRVPHMRARG